MASDTTSIEEVLAGSVERVTFHNPDNGFCVLRVKATATATIAPTAAIPLALRRSLIWRRFRD